MIEKAAQFTNNIPASGTLNRKPAMPGIEENVTAQAGDSYKSGSSSKSPHIILPSQEMTQKLPFGSIYRTNESKLSSMNIKVEQRIPIIGGYLANIDEDGKKALSEAGFLVFEDKTENWLPTDPVKMALADVDEGKDTKNSDPPAELVERPKMTEPRFDTPLTRKYNGEGVGIAIIDSGIYPHPDLITPKNRIVAFVDFVNGKRVPYDDGGHGTHVAGDAAGNGALSDGLYKGAAPGANLIGLKALAGSGGGKTSDVIKSIQWCIQNKEKYNIRVINMSLGHTAQKEWWNDPTNIAIKRAYEAGIVVVTSAGNSGPKDGTLTAPADSPHVLSVGAADDNNTPNDPSDDKVASFSSRGPALSGLIKPDILAPGEAIISTYSPGTENSSRRSNNLHETLKWLWSMPDKALMNIPEENLKLYGFADTTIDRWFKSPKQARKEISRIFKAVQKSPLVDEAYVGKPGTSMASPMAAGVAAQVIQANPDLSPDEVFQIITMTADKLPGDVPKTHQGNGMIDPEEAIQKALDVKEGKLELIPRKIEWPTDKEKTDTGKEAEKGGKPVMGE